MEHNIENVKKEGKVAHGAVKVLEFDLAGNKQSVLLSDGSVVEKSIYPSKVVDVVEPKVVEAETDITEETTIEVVELEEPVVAEEDEVIPSKKNKKTKKKKSSE